MELPNETKYSPKGIIPIQVERVRRTSAVIFRSTHRSRGRTTTKSRARPGSTRRPQFRTKTRRTGLGRAVPAWSRAVTSRATTTNAREPSRKRRHDGFLVASIRRLDRRGSRHTSRTGRASRRGGPTPATLLTQTGPILTGRTPAAPLRAGRLQSELMSTGQTGRRGSTSRSHPTRSGHTTRRTSKGG